MNVTSAKFRFRAMLLLFMAGLVVSGVTAFPLLFELRLLARALGEGSPPASANPHGGLAFWVVTVHQGLETTYARYPWVAYGTDWLAFGHLVIALFFVGPLVDPASSRATLYAGIVACLGVIPLALICGPLRGIPFYWRLIDCSFGLLGLFPLIYCLRQLPRIEAERDGKRTVQG